MIALLSLVAFVNANAVDITSSSFSCFVNRTDIPESVNEKYSFGSDSWWGGGEVFTPWELSPDSKVEAMGEYMWTGSYPVWNGSEWGGNLFYTGSSDYGSFIIYRRGEIERNTNPNTKEVSAGGFVEAVDKASGDPIGRESFSLLFTRESSTTNYVPSARFTPTAESAVYHALDAFLERRFFAGEFTNHTWSVGTYGPREPEKAWFHLSDDPDDPLGDNPRRECYYSPQRGVELIDPTNRTIITKRFVEYQNTVSNFVALTSLAVADFDAYGDRIHYPEVGRTFDEIGWSSSFLWEMWEDAAPDAVTTWSDVYNWEQLKPRIMPKFSGFAPKVPFDTAGRNGYQIRFIYPEDHCFGNADRINYRSVKLRIPFNRAGELRLYTDPYETDYLPVTVERFIASNYTISAYSAFTNTPPTRRFDPTFLAANSQLLALMNKTQATSDDAMDTPLNERRHYYRTANLHNRLAIELTNKWSVVAGGWKLDEDLEVDEVSLSGWSMTDSTNEMFVVSMTNPAPNRCSAWVHLDATDERFESGLEAYSFSNVITSQLLTDSATWESYPRPEVTWRSP